ncbi:MAG: hypothetical protein Q4F75_04095 [Pseudomonadota bacterium]|nr:hypothetical protein [Pseudomonadota bacterium]
MRRIFLMSSVLFVAPFVFGEMGEVSAQCVATTDCASLGYTEASCPNGGIKCPFGNSWNCKGDGCGTSYKYTCTGANQIKPISGACGRKYVSCSCAPGYEWKSGACSKALPKCQIGYIYYTDNTCSYNMDSTKTPKGVVVYAKSGGGGYAVTGPSSSAPNSYLMENHYYDNMPKLSLAEAKTNFNDYGGLGIPAGAAQSMLNNMTEVAYGLAKARFVNFEDFSWANYRSFITSTAVEPTTIGGGKAVWGFSIRLGYYTGSGSNLTFDTSGLIQIPLSAFDGNIYMWQGFEF